MFSMTNKVGRGADAISVVVIVAAIIGSSSSSGCHIFWLTNTLLYLA